MTRLLILAAAGAYLALIGTTSGVLVGTRISITNTGATQADCTYWTGGTATVMRPYWGDVCPRIVRL